MGESKSSIKLIEKIASKSSHRLLAISLIPLYCSIWLSSWIIDDPVITKTLFLLHIGIFLFWQPFISHKTEIKTRPTIILILAILGITYLGGYWAQTIWIIFLVGILSSYRLSSLHDKLIYLLIMSYLFIELFAGLLPRNVQADTSLLLPSSYISYISISVLLLAIILPTKSGTFRNYASDLLYSIIAISVVVILAMTTLLWMSYGNEDYYVSLIYSLMTLAAVLIGFNMIFRPNSEVGMLAQFRDRYLLNLGTPFESFLIEAAEISQTTEDPDEYLQKSFEKLSKLEWVNGFHWQSYSQASTVGQQTHFKTQLNFDELDITLYSNQELGPAMSTHSRLLVQLVVIFYEAKKRELTLSRTAHMEAIYETGARLTHDIKNLLQSLNLMLSAANARPSMSAEDTKLFFKNLEIITQRLQQTLVKLRNPETLSEDSTSLHKWWTDAKQREASNSFIIFIDELYEAIEVPEELFNSVLDNLLDNAKKKQHREPDLQVEVKLISTLDTLELTVRDSGTPVPESIANKLLSGPVKSQSGFGIGLYQAAKQATAQGYDLSIKDNIKGEVCFSLLRV